MPAVPRMAINGMVLHRYLLMNVSLLTPDCLTPTSSCPHHPLSVGENNTWTGTFIPKESGMFRQKPYWCLYLFKQVEMFGIQPSGCQALGSSPGVASAQTLPLEKPAIDISPPGGHYSAPWERQPSVTPPTKGIKNPLPPGFHSWFFYLPLRPPRNAWLRLNLDLSIWFDCLVAWVVARFKTKQ